MTTPAPSPVSPAGQATFPKVFDGIGALVVNCALDPDQLADRIPGLTWIAFKVGGTDVAADAETAHCARVWRGRGLSVGQWVYCSGPPAADIATAMRQVSTTAPAFLIYDVEAEYKSDEGGHYEWAAELVANAPAMPSAVTSYGGYKTSIDFAAFARAGWPILAQCYDSFGRGDQWSYDNEYGGPYETAGIHALVRSLDLAPGEAVYRPESIDS